MLEGRKCEVCDGNNFDFVLNMQDFRITKEYFDIYKCSNCGFHFTANPPTEESIGRYYHDEDYISHSDTKEGMINKLYHVARSIMLGRKLALIKRYSKYQELLDIGTGTGYFPAYMKQHNYKVSAIEADAESRSIATNKIGQQVMESTALFDGSLKEPYGVITMWHVLEHLYDPNKYMAAIHRILKKDGHLIIALPNQSGFDAQHYKEYWDGYEVPRHLWHFSSSTFEQFASKAGFNLVGKKSLPFDPFYICMRSEKAKGSSLALVKGVVKGVYPFIKGLLNPDHGSSIVYILQKK